MYIRNSHSELAHQVQNTFGPKQPKTHPTPLKIYIYICNICTYSMSRAEFNRRHKGKMPQSPIFEDFYEITFFGFFLLMDLKKY